jgi:integrase
MLIKEYLKDCKARLKITAYYDLKSTINNQICPYFKDKLVDDIRPIDIRKWQTKLLNKTPKLSASYIDSNFNILKRILNYGVKFYNISENVASKAGKIKLRKPKKIQFWTEDEFHMFIPHLLHRKQSYTIFYILFYTGMRIGELLALRLDDIDLTKKIISIDKTYKRFQRQDLIWPPKTASSIRTLSIPYFLVTVIQQYLDTLKQYEPHQRLFTISKSTLRKDFKQYSKKAGIKQIRIHDLRHSHASHLIDLDFSPKLIQQRLGHKKVTTTLEIYAHLYPNKQKEISKKLDELYEHETND